MSELFISIGQVKREISQLLNRVAYGDEKIVLTSRGKPKAVIVSLQDYERIQQAESAKQQSAWEQWLAANAQLSAKILAENGNEPLDIDAVLADTRADLEERHDFLLGH